MAVTPPPAVAAFESLPATPFLSNSTLFPYLHSLFFGEEDGTNIYCLVPNCWGSELVFRCQPDSPSCPWVGDLGSKPVGSLSLCVMRESGDIGLYVLFVAGKKTHEKVRW